MYDMEHFLNRLFSLFSGNNKKNHMNVLRCEVKLPVAIFNNNPSNYELKKKYKITTMFKTDCNKSSL